MGSLLRAYGRILHGYHPLLSIEITRECPLACPGCYAYGLQPEHHARRSPATYDRILKNIDSRKAGISWVVTNPILRRADYLDEYLTFWTTRPEIGRIWLNLHRPQQGEQSPETLSPESLRQLSELKGKYPTLMLPGCAVEALSARRPDCHIWGSSRLFAKI